MEIEGQKVSKSDNPLVVAPDRQTHTQTGQTDTLTHKLFWTPTQ